MKTFYNSVWASRPFLWINTALPFAAGWLIVTTQLDWRFFVIFIFFLFPYNLAMYGINDIYDFESDIKNPRKASVEGAQLQKQELLKLWKYILGLTIPFIIAIVITGTGLSNAVLLFAMFTVVAYSAQLFRFKEIPFVDSMTSSSHFVNPLLFGIIYAGGILAPFLPGIIAYFLWAMASHAFGAIQDIVYDREANISSIATVLGARSTIFFCSLLYIIAAVIVMIAYSLPGIIVGIGLLLYAVNTIRFYKITDANADKTNTGWRIFMALNMGIGALLTTGYLQHFNFFPIKHYLFTVQLS